MNLRGSIAALITPMTPDGALDLAAWDALLRWHLEEGTQGLVVGGTTGEAPTLSAEELEQLILAAVRRVAGRVPVIVGTGTNSTNGTIERTQRAAALGADAAMVVTPYYNKPTPAGLLAHYTAVADASPVPLILYNVPGRTGVDMRPDVVEQLSSNPRIVAIKEASGSIERICDLRERLPPDFAVLTGDDHLIKWALEAGACGVISVLANVVPGGVRTFCAAIHRGDEFTARIYELHLAPLAKALFVESNPIPVKWALAKMGRIAPGIRLPLTWLSPQNELEVRVALALARPI
jgi:4-hydroxy-tetrahydrodipicolinate synthase